jgi:hypothetical protein
MHDALPPQWFGEPVNLVYEPARSQRGVVAERFVPDVDEWEH